MSVTQFPMVEELAFLIKDNLPCKHLVLSMEEALVNFLQDEMSSDGMLELEPMNSYNRLLVHRLADIFGFSHQSVGEGDDRHIILERCPETSIPSILVSDLLWQYDEFEAPMSHQLLRRKEASPGSNVEKPTYQFSLKEREAAYLAARERIFSMDDGESKEPIRQKPRNIPVVARRMIAHALGQRIEKSDDQSVSVRTAKEYGEQNSLKDPSEKENAFGKPKVVEIVSSTSSSDIERKVPRKMGDKLSTRDGVPGNLKEEHMGAAKRIFAHALGFQSAKDDIFSKCSGKKQTDKSKLLV